MKFLVALLALFALSGCGLMPGGEPDIDVSAETSGPIEDFGLRWVATSAEYHAITRTIYAAATADLPELIADTSFSAVPGQSGYENLPPAVILDVDETVASNLDFQVNHMPYSNEKHEAWSAATSSDPIQGVVEFIAAARAQGVEVFFVTNRPCSARRNNPCPQRQVAIDDIAEAGIQTDADHVFLSEERGWTREKVTRREHVAQTHRVIMLFGDDYGDFIFCTRATAQAPCARNATQASRMADLDTYNDYWGRGWYILPNPMYGSWTTVE